MLSPKTAHFEQEFLCERNNYIWSAATCRRFSRQADLSAGKSRAQRLEDNRSATIAFDGDKSPAESADNSAHSKWVAISRRWTLEPF